MKKKNMIFEFFELFQKHWRNIWKNVIFEIVTALKGDVETLCRGCQLLQPTVPSWQMKSNQGWNIKEKIPKIYLYLLIYNILRWQVKFIKKDIYNKYPKLTNEVQPRVKMSPFPFNTFETKSAQKIWQGFPKKQIWWNI